MPLLMTNYATDINIIRRKKRFFASFPTQIWKGNLSIKERVYVKLIFLITELLRLHIFKVRLMKIKEKPFAHTYT